jgi:hypothetical protein
MNVSEFRHLYVLGHSEVGGDGCTVVEAGDWETEHKMQYKTDIYAVGEEHFAVDFTRSNSGYWSDSEWYEPEVRKVTPKLETITVVRWVSAEDK